MNNENEYLNLIESGVPLPLRGSARRPHPLTVQFMQTLQLMDIQKSSIVIKKEDASYMERAAVRLGYTIKKRSIDDRGVIKYRFWVLSHEASKKQIR